ncbi:MAG: hypothetical protein ACEQSB_03750 [Undibacterium sp.]
MAWLKDTWKRFLENKGTFWLALAFLLVSALSFEAGMVQRALTEKEPLVVRVPATLPAVTAPERSDLGVKPVTETKEVVQPAVGDGQGGCAFVGSKNSNKYHIPASRCAKQIKPANRVCFASAEAAQAKGYLPGCLE